MEENFKKLQAGFEDQKKKDSQKNLLKQFGKMTTQEDDLSQYDMRKLSFFVDETND